MHRPHSRYNRYIGTRSVSQSFHFASSVDPGLDYRCGVLGAQIQNGHGKPDHVV